MAGHQVAGWFASAFVGKLVDKVDSYIGDQYEYQNTTKIKEKLGRLEGNIPKVQAVIYAADQTHIKNPGLQKWLHDFKDACYDAEDVLDSFEYQLLEDKVEAKTKEPSQVAKQIFFLDDDLNKLFEVVDRLDKLMDQIGVFLHLLNFDRAHTARDKDGETKMEWRSTFSDCKEPKLFGRDTEKTRLIKLLREKGDDGVGPSRKLHVLPIVGTGGVGKTTLAQSVYNDQSLQELFDLTAWVCVSDKFELRRLMVEIIESANIRKPLDFYHIKSLDRIVKILTEGLKGGRFLLVLDDVWDNKPDEWEKLHLALESGNDGSKVIVTTRSHEITNMMGTKKAIYLGGLPDKEYWQYFVHCAFGGVCTEHHPNLIFFAEKIVKKLGGLPLAAKVIGGVLKSSLEVGHWKKISESKWWQVDRPKDQIMPVLRLSYDYLPADLKRCFVYCSLFPKDFRFSRKKLVQLWMAQGYIQDNEENTMENIGDDYFKELLSRSFFEKVDRCKGLLPKFLSLKVRGVPGVRGVRGGYEEDEYVIHDLLHDLAQSLSDGESFTVDDYMSDLKPVDIPKMVRHIYTSANNLSVVCNDKYAKKNLKSLVVSGCRDISLDILEELEGLRVLILDGVHPSSLPECFRKMLHLRYLEINRNGYPPLLPQSLGKLYHLQVLALRDNISLYSWPSDCRYSLPKGINRLIKLRHLYAPTGKTPGIGTLTSLQELIFFVKKEKGFEMWQLSDMSQLRELSLHNLENVESKEEASEARLCSKRNLKQLSLDWGPGNHSDHGGVLEGLEPPEKLEHLGVRGYNGNCPSWWSRNCLTYLNHISLSSCSGSWEILPPFGQLPLLRYLRLDCMKAVKRIGPEFYGSNNTKPFPSLEKLVLKEMSELVEWSKPEGEGIELFPRLYFLEVDGFPKLRGPLCLPSHYKELRVRRWRNVWGRDKEGIYLFGCPSLSRLIEWIPMQNLASLEKVEINSYEITSFTSEQEEWFQHLTSLQSLSFDGCKKLQSLPSILSLSTLRKLSVWDCPSLQSLPEEGLPSSLTSLLLLGISQGLEERCSEGGLDWHKISHIPHVNFRVW